MSLGQLTADYADSDAEEDISSEQISASVEDVTKTSEAASPAVPPSVEESPATDKSNKAQDEDGAKSTERNSEDHLSAASSPAPVPSIG